MWRFKDADAPAIILRGHTVTIPRNFLFNRRVVARCTTGACKAAAAFTCGSLPSLSLATRLLTAVQLAVTSLAVLDDSTFASASTDGVVRRARGATARL